MHKSLCVSEKHFGSEHRAAGEAGGRPATGLHPPVRAQGSFLQPDQKIRVSVLPQTQSRYKVSAGVALASRGLGKLGLPLAQSDFTMVQSGI